MKLLLQSISKSSHGLAFKSARFTSYVRQSSRFASQVQNPWICQQCQQRSQLLGRFYFRTALTKRDPQSNVTKLEWHGSQLRRASTSSQTGQSHGKNETAPSMSREDLPSQEEGRRSQVSKRFSHIMDNVQSNIFIAGQRLNDLTGYSGIETLKKDIEEQEDLVRTTRSALQQAKETYSAAISQRSASQRESNELLQRKHMWSPQDLERFTSLYRSDHANEQTEAAAQEAVTDAERKAEEASVKLSASILARYHEEQIWSDKIRRMSTWGTWGLMGVNVLLFLVFQIGVEPWRRKRLVKGFEEKVIEALEKESASTNATTGAALAALQASHKNSSIEMTPETPESESNIGTLERETTVDEVKPEEIILPPQVDIPIPSAFTDASITERIHILIARYKEAAYELFSDRQITMRRADLTAATIEGTFYGIALASIIASLIRSR